MRALVAHGAFDVRIEEWDEPVAGVGEVVVGFTHGGICGSDLHYYRHGAVGDFVLREPLVLGHEVVGRVHADPEGLLPAGTAVAVHPATVCGSCPECRDGQPQVCRHARYFGSAATTPHTQGGFTERRAVRRGQLRPLPDGLALDRAVLAEPLAVGLHAIVRAGGVDGQRVLVTGAGPIGTLAAGAAKAAGAAEVWATDPHPLPLRNAARAGADRTVRTGETAETGEQALPEQYFDTVLECSGAPAAVGAAVRAVRRRGTVVQVGSLPGGAVAVELASLVAREVDYRGTFRFADEIDRAVELLADPAVGERLAAAITHRFPLARAVEALRVAADAGASGKVVLVLEAGAE